MIKTKERTDVGQTVMWQNSYTITVIYPIYDIKKIYTAYIEYVGFPLFVQGL